jgi:hypothetical protein
MQKTNSIIILLFIYLKYETAAGCRKPFLCCDVGQFLTPSAVIISITAQFQVFELPIFYLEIMPILKNGRSL